MKSCNLVLPFILIVIAVLIIYKFSVNTNEQFQDDVIETEPRICVKYRTNDGREKKSCVKATNENKFVEITNGNINIGPAVCDTDGEPSVGGDVLKPDKDNYQEEDKYYTGPFANTFIKGNYLPGGGTFDGTLRGCERICDTDRRCNMFNYEKLGSNNNICNLSHDNYADIAERDEEQSDELKKKLKERVDGTPNIKTYSKLFRDLAAQGEYAPLAGSLIDDSSSDSIKCEETPIVRFNSVKQGKTLGYYKGTNDQTGVWALPVKTHRTYSGAMWKLEPTTSPGREPSEHSLGFFNIINLMLHLFRENTERNTTDLHKQYLAWDSDEKRIILRKAPYAWDIIKVTTTDTTNNSNTSKVYYRIKSASVDKYIRRKPAYRINHTSDLYDVSNQWNIEYVCEQEVANILGKLERPKWHSLNYVPNILRTGNNYNNTARITNKPGVNAGLKDIPPYSSHFRQNFVRLSLKHIETGRYLNNDGTDHPTVKWATASGDAQRPARVYDLYEEGKFNKNTPISTFVGGWMRKTINHGWYASGLTSILEGRWLYAIRKEGSNDIYNVYGGGGKTNRSSYGKWYFSGEDNIYQIVNEQHNCVLGYDDQNKLHAHKLPLPSNIANKYLWEIKVYNSGYINTGKTRGKTYKDGLFAIKNGSNISDCMRMCRSTNNCVSFMQDGNKCYLYGITCKDANKTKTANGCRSGNPNVYDMINYDEILGHGKSMKRASNYYKFSHGGWRTVEGGSVRKLKNKTIKQCLNECVADGTICRSAEYDVKTRKCNLLKTKPGDQKKIIARYSRGAFRLGGTVYHNKPIRTKPSKEGRMKILFTRKFPKKIF